MKTALLLILVIILIYYNWYITAAVVAALLAGVLCAKISGGYNSPLELRPEMAAIPPLFDHTTAADVVYKWVLNERNKLYAYLSTVRNAVEYKYSGPTAPPSSSKSWFSKRSIKSNKGMSSQIPVWAKPTTPSEKIVPWLVKNTETRPEDLYNDVKQVSGEPIKVNLELGPEKQQIVLYYNLLDELYSSWLDALSLMESSSEYSEALWKIIEYINYMYRWALVEYGEVSYPVPYRYKNGYGTYKYVTPVLRRMISEFTHIIKDSFDKLDTIKLPLVRDDMSDADIDKVLQDLTTWIILDTGSGDQHEQFHLYYKQHRTDPFWTEHDDIDIGRKILNCYAYAVIRRLIRERYSARSFTAEERNYINTIISYIHDAAAICEGQYDENAKRYVRCGAAGIISPMYSARNHYPVSYDGKMFLDNINKYLPLFDSIYEQSIVNTGYITPQYSVAVYKAASV